MYIIDFDIVAVLFIAISLYLFYFRKKVADEQSRRFRVLLWTTLGSAVFGVASSLAINALPSLPPAAALWTSTIFYFCHNSIPILVARYVLALRLRREARPIFRALFALPWFTAIALIVSNPLSRHLFYIDATGAYRHGGGLPILYLLSSVYLLIILVAVVSRTSILSPPRRAAFLASLVLPVIAIIIQNIFPGLMLECFAASISMLFVLLTIQNNSDLLDGQTGLFNREAFVQFLQQAFALKPRFAVVVVHSSELASMQSLLDNRSYGQVTRVFADWLARVAGKPAITSVLDDGLFALIMEPGHRGDHADAVVSAILERADEAWDFDGLRIDIPVRLGILRFPEDCACATEALDRIDQLVDLPGQLGDHRIFVSSDFVPDKRLRESAIAFALRDRIVRSDLELRYQPIYSVEEKRAVAVEALIGVRLESGEWVRQSECLKSAERMGLARDLSKLFIERACSWFVANGTAERGIEKLQIRLDAARCVELDWPNSIMRSIRGCGMDPARLCLEITETAAANLGQDLEINMRLLAGQGIGFALDDYGSGYTDLGQVSRMPFTIVKLDKQIIKAGMEGRKGRQLLEGSVSLFKHLRLDIVAEGVETAEQAVALSAMGCGYLQGFYFGGPMEGAKALARLE